MAEYLSLGYPISWILILLVISAVLFIFQCKVSGSAILILSFICCFGVTPLGSEWFLDSISTVFNTENMKCDANDPPKSIIILPGGLTDVDSKVVLTRWSSDRVEWLKSYIEKSNIAELIIPGGDRYRDQQEGRFIKKNFDKQEFNTFDIKIGAGSYSTYSNYLEIREFIDAQEYGLITSKWHGYRASKVASKQGIKICLLAMISNHKTENIERYPWAFKAALREYLAIAWYKLKGRI